MPEHYCQSCGMMFTAPGQHGHEADGSEAEDFCRWCYENGVYTYETSMDEMIEDCAPRMAEAMGWTVDEGGRRFWVRCCRRSAAGVRSPRTRRLTARRLARHTATGVVDATNEKYLAMGEAAHLQAEELAVAINEQLRRAMVAGDPAGPEARRLVEMHGRWLRMYWPEGHLHARGSQGSGGRLCCRRAVPSLLRKGCAGGGAVPARRDPRVRVIVLRGCLSDCLHQYMWETGSIGSHFERSPQMSSSRALPRWRCASRCAG